MPAQAVLRLDRWCAAGGACLERVRYPRPEAGGEVNALRIVPRGRPRARVVAAHGAGNDALFPMVALFKALVADGCEVFAFDLDGHGRDSTTVFSPDRIASALPAAVRAAEAGRAPLPLHLLGHSFGGSLVLHALAEAPPEGTASAVGISAPLGLALSWAVAMGEVRGFLRADTLRQREHYGLWGVVPALGPLKRRDYPWRGAATAVARLGYVGEVRRSLDAMALESAAARIRHPVLIVDSDADRLVPPSHGERLARAIPGAELRRLHGPSHWGVPFATETVEHVRRWIAERTPAEAACA